MNEMQYKHLVEVYAKEQASIIEQLMKMLLRLWIPFRWSGNPDMINAWAAGSAVRVDIAAAKARQLSRSFMVAQLQDLDAMPDSLPEVEDLYPRSGTPIVEVYKRPARQFDYQKSKGKSDEEATEALTQRLEKIVTADLTTAARDEAHTVMKAAPKVIGYRRIIHPELSKTGTCGLCVVAADRFYSREDLQALHDLCKCTVAAFTAESDPGLKLNSEDLDALYNAAGSNYMEDLKRIRVKKVEHGELGPILTPKGDEFKNVSRVNDQSKRRKYAPYKPPTRRSNEVSWAGMKRTSEQCIEILKDAKREGTSFVDLTGRGRFTYVRDMDQAIQFHLDLIARADSHLA